MSDLRVPWRAEKAWPPGCFDVLDATGRFILLSDKATAEDLTRRVNDYDRLAARVAELERERDAARRAAEWFATHEFGEEVPEEFQWIGNRLGGGIK